MTNLVECAKHEMIGCQMCSPPPVAANEPDSPPFRALYDGHCPECNLPIMSKHHSIVLRSHSWGRQAIHETCA